MRPDRAQYTNIYLPPRKLIGLTRREPWQLNGAVLHLSPQQKLPSASRLEAATVWAPGRKVVPLHYMADRFSKLSTLNSQGRIFWGQFEQKSEIGYRIFLNCYHLPPKEHDSRSGNLPRSDPSTRKALTYWSDPEEAVMKVRNWKMGLRWRAENAESGSSQGEEFLLQSVTAQWVFTEKTKPKSFWSHTWRARDNRHKLK